MRYMPATAVFLLIGISLLSAPVHATEHGETSGSDKTETAEPTEKPPLSEAIPENTADGFGVEDLNRDELGVDLGAVRKVVVIDGSRAIRPPSTMRRASTARSPPGGYAPASTRTTSTARSASSHSATRRPPRSM